MGIPPKWIVRLPNTVSAKSGVRTLLNLWQEQLQGESDGTMPLRSVANVKIGVDELCRAVRLGAGDEVE